MCPCTATGMPMISPNAIPRDAHTRAAVPARSLSMEAKMSISSGLTTHTDSDTLPTGNEADTMSPTAWNRAAIVNMAATPRVANTHRPPALRYRRSSQHLRGSRGSMCVLTASTQAIEQCSAPSTQPPQPRGCDDACPNPKSCASRLCSNSAARVTLLGLAGS